MRDSCVRVRPAHDHAVIVLATLTLLSPAALAFEWFHQGPLDTWRAVLAPLSSLAGIAQGAALVSALMRMSDWRWRPGLRRAAELLGLGLPAAWLCQMLLVYAGGVLAPGAPLHRSLDIAHLALSAVLCACGTLYVITSMRADGHLPLHDGWFARVLDPARWTLRSPQHRRRARAQALGYVIVYVAAAPWLGAHSVGMMRLDQPVAIPGADIALADVFLALAVAVLMEAAACARDPENELLSESDVSAAAVPLLGLAGILGALVGLEAVARGALGGSLGLFPTPARGEILSSLSTFGAFLGFAIPVCLLARRSARADALTVSLASGLGILGVVMERGAMLTPARAPVHSLAEAGTVAGFAAIAGLFVVWSLRTVGFEGATQGPLRRSSLDAAVS